MDVMRTRYVKRMEKCSVASNEVSGHVARSNSSPERLQERSLYTLILKSVLSLVPNGSVVKTRVSRT